jgi:hypothetical protein
MLEVYHEIRGNVEKLYQLKLKHHPQEKLPLSLGFFEFVHNVRKRGKALLPALLELLVT